MTTKRSRARGFTLIETLVALAILGAVVTAVLALISQSARFVATSEDRLLAGVLADNLMVDALAGAAPLERNETEAEVEFAGSLWATRQLIVETGLAGVVRIDVSVRRAGSQQTLAAATSLKKEGE